MNSEAYRNFLLSHIPSAKNASGGKVVNCRCFFCPDSKDKSHGHFYISIPQNNNEPSLYYCHKCHSRGVVTYKSLIEWDIYEDNIAMDLIAHNKGCKSVVSKYSNKIKYILANPYTTDSENTRLKLKYINDRIGYRFSYKDLRDLKIILNLNDLLKANYINKFTRDERVIEQLDYNFIGFLSIDNAFLNMRRLCDKGLVTKSIDKRYINYNIFDKYNTSERFYTIPTSINILSRERIKIHIAEGPFDILSIYVNQRKREPGIYTSVGGSNYLGIIMYFLETYKIPNAEIHLYPDNDKYGGQKAIDKINRYLKPLNIPLVIHRNMMPGEKDFGVTPDKIQESVYIV